MPDDPRYVVDGTHEDGNFSGDGESAPFVVFDKTNQTWLPPRYYSRESAQIVADELNESGRRLVGTALAFETERYCEHLDRLGRVEAIRAIHQAYLQLAALNTYADCGHYDNAPALNALLACLRAAGHPAGPDYPEGGAV